ncbi:MAG: D-Ala-D-Ala carboxypeptidase family metallohydrolase [Cyanobacteria bacterium P01_D01_bin.73]
MPLLRVKQPTVFKVSEAQSFMLAADDKLSVRAGELWASEVVDSGGHYRVTLQEDLGGRKQWFVFRGHAEVSYQDPPTPPPADDDLGSRGLDKDDDDDDASRLTIVVTKGTVFKTKPEDSSTLPSSEKISVAAGEYTIKQVEDAGSHVKVQLLEPLDDRIEWFVFKGHLDLVNLPTKTPSKDDPEPVIEPKVEVLRDTIFKTKPIQSTDLDENEKVIVAPGSFLIKSAKPDGKHYLLTLVDSLEGRADWFAFSEHIKFEDADEILEQGKTAAAKEDEKEEVKPETPAPPRNRGRMINIPGFGQVGTNDLIISGGHFTWGEATKGGSRIPANSTISRNIVRMAERMEEVRSRLGNRSISVTSWYRPPAVNRAIGGARNSTHFQGYAVDFNASGLSPRSVQRMLDPWWSGGLGYGRSFTHLDDRGYRTRWNYS